MDFKKILTSGALAAAIIAGGASVPANAFTAPITQSSIQSAHVSSVSTPAAVKIATAAKTKKMKTKTALNVRKNAGTKYKRIGTLKKGATVTVVKTKSGWSQVKSGKLSGWVSSKYLTNITAAKPKTKVKKAAPKKSSTKKLAISKVKTYSDAQKYLKQSCKGVKIKQISGNVSHYNPNNRTIAIAKSHVKSSRMGFVFVHEFSHHLQWTGKYKNNVSGWNKAIRNKSLEVQADQMAYYLHGGVGKGVYTKKKATGKSLTNIKNIYSKGMKAGC